MELRELRYFYAVARHEHYTLAADELHIAQPALSKTIHQLEDELKVPLFYKQGRNVKLTVYGEYLKSKAEVILPVFDNLAQELETQRDIARRTVTINVLAASTVVTDVIISYKKKNPAVIFKTIQNATQPNCDIVVTTNTLKGAVTTQFAKVCVIEENIYLAVPKNSHYAARDSIALREVAHEGFVNLSGSRLFRAVCDHFCAYAGFKSQSIFEGDSPLTVKNLIGASVGIGFWPEFSWGKLKTHDVILLPISDPVCTRDIIVGYNSLNSMSEYSQDFFEHLQTQLSSHGTNKR